MPGISPFKKSVNAFMPGISPFKKCVNAFISSFVLVISKSNISSLCPQKSSGSNGPSLSTDEGFFKSKHQEKVL